MNFFKKKSEKPTDWAEYLNISPDKIKRAVELDKQIRENGIYTVFDEKNSSSEITKRLNQEEEKKLRKSELHTKRIEIILAAATGLFVPLIIWWLSK